MILRYFLVDDCWSIKDHRDPDTGRIIPDLEKFPSGIDGLADKIHDMGLKIGIYSSMLLQPWRDLSVKLGSDMI